MAESITRPHLVVIMADQLRHDLIGAYTPNIKALMADGCTFTRAYCASPLCVPARGAFFTGRYPGSTGCLINPWQQEDAHHGRVRAGTPNLYGLIEQEWDSRHTGKQHFFTEERTDESKESLTSWFSIEKYYPDYLKQHGVRPPGGARFCAPVPEMVDGRRTTVQNYSTPATGVYEPGIDFYYDGYIRNTTLKAVEERDRSKPLALNCMFLAPHPPLEIPEPWFSMVRKIPMPGNVGEWYDGQSPLQLYNLPGMLGSHYSRDDWCEVWRVYAGLVALLDDCIGEVIDKLKAEDLYDNAVIVFTSDHGEMLGSHRLWQKMCNYEEAVRVPLSIKPPNGVKFVPEIGTPVSHLDVLPTLCDLLGLKKPDQLDGRSLLPAIQGKAVLEEKDIFIQYDGNGARGNFSRCVIRGSDKLIVDLFKDEFYFELYDLQTDSEETTNRVFQCPEKAEELLEALIDHMRKTRDLVQLSSSDFHGFLEEWKRGLGMVQP